MSADLLTRLAAIVGEAHVVRGMAAEPYLREWRGAFRPAALTVVRPADTAQVAAVVTACAGGGCAVVPQSGNTGLVGGAAASDAQRHVIVNLERLDRVRALDVDDATLTVEAGCVLADAQQAAADAGLYLPLQLASRERCRIGGNLATNAGGLNVLRYGNTRDLVLGLEVVLADGRIWSNLSGLRKDNSSFALNDLFVGSEGTLGIITAATLRLHDRHVQRAVALLALDTPAQAIALQRRLSAASGGNVVGCELMCDQVVALAEQHVAGCTLPFSARHDWYLLVELATSAHGDWLAPILSGVVNEAIGQGEVAAAVIAADDVEAAALWYLRESLPPAQVAEGASIKHDISLPVSRLPEFLARALTAVADALPGARPCPFGHVGDGNLHFNLSRPSAVDDATFLRQAESAHRLVHDLVVRMGGSFAAEHGIGRLKLAEMARYKTPVELDMLRRIKYALDPENRLNPGVIVDPAIPG